MKPDNMSNSLSLSFRSLKAVAAMGVAMTLTSLVVGCTDDFMPERTSSGREIRFNMVVDDGEWQSRADGGEPETEYVGVYPLDGTADGDSLFLHVQVIKGIQREDTEELPMDSTEFLPGSRTSLIQSTGDIKSMGVFGSAYFGEWDESDCCVDYMYDVKYTPLSDGETWGADMTCFWLKDRSFRFFAYAPSDNPALSFSLPDKPGTPTMYYTTDNPGKDPDLIIASPVDADGTQQIIPTLEFKHALASVTVDAQYTQIASGRMDSFRFINYYKSATIPMDGSLEWSDYSNVGSSGFTVSSAKGYVDKYGETKKGVSFGYYMFLPQELPDSAMLEVKYTEKWSGQTVTLTADLGGQVWEPGTTVKYTISTSRILVEDYFYGKNGVFSSSETWYPGDYEVWGNVYSCSKVTIDGVSKFVPQPWTMDFIDDNGNVIPAPSFIDTSNSKNAMSGKGTANITTGYYNRLYIRLKQLVNETDEHTSALKNAYNRDYYYDLSTDGTKWPMTTSNCYVINGPGQYRFPMYYGNSMTNGMANPQCYQNLVNYRGEEIKAGHIKTDIGEAPSKAVIVWQDVENLVQNVSIDKSGYVRFSVSAATIHQGNAIIGIKDSAGEMIWSWHIWVTDYDPYSFDGYRLADGGKYRVMSGLIGWCDLPKIIFSPRSFKVRFTQTNTGKQITGTYNLNSNILSKGYCPIYSWGRKDPLRGGAFGHFGMGDRINYVYSYNCESGRFPKNETVTSNVDMATLIKNPHISYFNRGYDSGYHKGEYTYIFPNTTALWNTSYKTVYDPSPRGYRVAPSSVYSNVTVKDHVAYDFWTVPFESPVSGSGKDIDYQWAIFMSDDGYTSYSKDDNEKFWTADYMGSYKAKTFCMNATSSTVYGNDYLLASLPINPVMEDWLAEKVEEYENAPVPEANKGFYNRHGQWVIDEYGEYFGPTPDGYEWYPYYDGFYQDSDGFWHEY